MTIPSTRIAASLRISSGSSTVHTCTSSPSRWAWATKRSVTTGTLPQCAGTCTASTRPFVHDQRVPGSLRPASACSTRASTSPTPSEVVARGSWRRRTARRRAEKEAKRTRSRASAARTTCRASWTTADSLRSILKRSRGKATRASSSLTGGRPSPASSSDSSFQVSSPMPRGSAAVRMRSESWERMTRPSALTRRSVSIQVNPSSATCSTAVQVFSGASPAPPRWAMTVQPRAATMLPRFLQGGRGSQEQSVVNSTAWCSVSQTVGSTVDSSASSLAVRTSKCRWAPVERPVEPTAAMSWPALTLSPTWT